MTLLDLPVQYIFAISSVLLLMGIFSSKISSWVNAPALLMFLGVGILAGPEGIGNLPFIHWNGINSMDYKIANMIGTLALCYILFSGGLDTNWNSIKRIAFTGGLLASLGVFITAILMGVFVHICFGMPLEHAILLGAIISSTDAAAVFAILRSKSVSLKGRMRPLLEFESGSNDPMAAFLTIFMIGMTKDPTQSYWVILPSFLIKMSVGILLGFSIGSLAARTFNKISLEYDGLYFVLGMGIVIMTYGFCEILYGNGFMATYVCGVAMGNKKFVFKNGFKRFHDAIAWLMQVVMFLFLGMLIIPSKLPSIAFEGIVLSIFLMFIARPVSVWLCMLSKKFNNRERTLISWGGIRGAAPIVLATFPAIHGVPNAEEYFSLIFFIVLMSVIVQGKTLMPVAKWLKLDKPLVERARSPIMFEETGEFESDMEEYVLEKNSPVIGKTLAEILLPPTFRILLIRRERKFIVPDGSTKLQQGDELLFLISPSEIKEALDSLSKKENHNPA